MTLKIMKTRFLNEADFQLLASMNPDIATHMFRNKMLVDGPKGGNVNRVKEMNSWIEENCSGLVYKMNHGTAKKFNFDLYFEEESDMVAFKLVFFNAD